MKITSVNVKRLSVSEGSKLEGLARVVIDNAFAVGDIRIIRGNGDKGLFLAFPSRKTTKGEFRDVCHPINPVSRKMFEDAVLAEFNKVETTEETASE
ncbi:MAG: SpoVG family protein [Bacilli bacterium]|nr:SpoVG family protein [Bacilli bacterium]